ncbi:hypothetical protein BLOT_002057 [Blomia tropicalis]|nr:hypothetical protein BLOT_002057 [Blomia tropicalis]
MRQKWMNSSCTIQIFGSAFNGPFDIKMRSGNFPFILSKQIDQSQTIVQSEQTLHIENIEKQLISPENKTLNNLQIFLN